MESTISRQAEQQILKLTDSDQFKKYLNTLAKFHHYSARNIDLIYAKNPQATQVAGFKQWQTAFNRTVSTGAQKRFGWRPQLLRS